MEDLEHVLTFEACEVDEVVVYQAAKHGAVLAERIRWLAKFHFVKERSLDFATDLVDVVLHLFLRPKAESFFVKTALVDFRS